MADLIVKRLRELQPKTVRAYDAADEARDIAVPERRKKWAQVIEALNARPWVRAELLDKKGATLGYVDNDQEAGELDDVLRLGLVQADGLDVIAQTRFAECEDRGRRVGDRPQLRGRLVDADVGGLRRQHHGDQQLEIVRVLQVAARIRIDRGEAAVQLGTVFEFHDWLCCLRSRARAIAATMSMPCAWAASTSPRRRRRASSRWVLSRARRSLRRSCSWRQRSAIAASL